MRALLTALAAAFLLPHSFAQNRAGTYQPKTGPTAQWSINEHHTLIWNGAPYLPVGLSLDGVPSVIAKARAELFDVVGHGGVRRGPASLVRISGLVKDRAGRRRAAVDAERA